MNRILFANGEIDPWCAPFSTSPARDYECLVGESRMPRVNKSVGTQVSTVIEQMTTRLTSLPPRLNSALRQ
eukprot:526992-Prorocentrum_minimum.AAC.2